VRRQIQGNRLSYKLSIKIIQMSYIYLLKPPRLNAAAAAAAAFATAACVARLREARAAAFCVALAALGGRRSLLILKISLKKGIQTYMGVISEAFSAFEQRFFLNITICLY
jgi:hypothetical protein